MIFFNNNKQPFYIIFAILALSAIFLLVSKLPRLAFNETNQLAQIVAIETKLLKQWQQSKGLKNTLAYNSSGSDVVLLQRMLSQDASIYHEKKITGYYGNLTKDAVIKFQHEYNLLQTGIVDTATKNKLNEIFLSHLCPEQTIIYPDFFFRRITKQLRLPNDYVPPALEDISEKLKTVGVICVRQEVAQNLINIFRAAENDGIYLAITSGYRKPEIQKYLYDFWLSMYGADALDAIAEPGASEHQLGTAVDITDASIGYAGVDNRFADSEGGKWLQQNAHKYGFVMSYPKGKEKATGYQYEPWHWRFVGVDVAISLYNQGLTFNESSFNVKEKPYPKENIKAGVDLSANAVVSIFVDTNGIERTLLEKNKEDKLPIASLTKLIVALVASDFFRPDDIVAVVQNALDSKGASGQYFIGDSFLFKDALNALLIGSHNEIAISMAEQIGTDRFIQRMNEKARALGLNNTHFVNVSGLDPEIGSEEINYSTVIDMAKLLRYIFENRADIFSVLEKNEYQFTDIYGVREMKVGTTNELIKNQNSALRVLGGKTGETPRAKMNLAIVSHAPSRGRIVNVVIGSENSFRDMQRLLEYIKESFIW